MGANMGMFSLFVHAMCPTVTVYAFEPLAPIFGKLQRNLALHGVSAHLFPYGLSDADRELDFTFYQGYSMMSGQSNYADAGADADVIKTYLSNERGTGDSRDELLGRLDELLDDRFQASQHHCRVRRLSDVIDEQRIERIDLLKIDVQRAELDVLLGVDHRHWPLVEQIAMEIHDAVGTPTEGRLDEIVRLLEIKGFDVLIEQDDELTGTDRFALSAVRPEYAADAVSTIDTEMAGELMDGAGVSEWLADRLPAHLIPSAIVVVDELPLTANGKLDRSALPSPTESRAPAKIGAVPETPAEQILVEAWQEVLGTAEVDVEDNVFLELGADSIRCIQVQMGAARRGLTLPLHSFFTHQTIRDLAGHGEVQLAGAGHNRNGPDSPFSLLLDTDWDRLPDGLDDAYPMSALQLGMVYHSELTGDPATYHNVTSHRIASRLDSDALREAVGAAMAAHPILRTSFELGRYQEPLQFVHHTVVVPLTVEDLQPFDQARQQDRIAEAVEEERVRPFEWGTPPLIRFRALNLGGDTFEFIVSEHHAILDGWSLHLLLDEVLNSYRGSVPAVAGPVLPYKRFIELERRVREDAASRDFWFDRLAGVRPLQVARAGGHGSTRRVAEDIPRITARRGAPIGLKRSRHLDQLAAELDVPLKSLLLAVHLRVLGETLGRSDVVTGLVVSGRLGEEGGDRTLGLFLNTLPVRVNLAGTSLAELAARAWQAEQELMGHHLFPLADIERALDARPLFDVFFNFTRFHQLGTTQHRGARIVGSRSIPVDVAFSLAVDFEVEPTTGELDLVVQYDGRRLVGEWVTALVERYHRMLELAVTSDPMWALSSLAAAPSSVSDGWHTRVREIWDELIGVPPHDSSTDFFTAGGDSLLALRFVAALRDRFGVTIPLPDFIRRARFDALTELCTHVVAVSEKEAVGV